jgi:hypothetical protein
MDEQQQPQQCLLKSSIIGAGEQCSAVLPRFIEKSVIVHKDENGFGLRIKGQSPVFVEHVHENGAAWRAGVRAFDLINKVNGVPVSHMGHKDVVLTFKSCSRFVALTLVSAEQQQQSQRQQQQPREFHLMENCSLKGAIGAGFEPEGRLGGDKRFAVCVCCRSFFDGRQKPPPVGAATAYAQCRLMPHTRQLHASLRDARQVADRLGATRGALAMQHRPFDRSADERLANCAVAVGQPTIVCEPAADACAVGGGGGGAGRDQSGALIKRIPQSISINSLPSIGARNDSRLSAKPPLAGRADSQRLSPLAVAHQATPASSSSTQTLTKTGAAGATTTTKRSPVVNKRLEIIREFIDTERTHTERLRCLNELFYRPLKQAGFMSPEQLRMIFSCHRTLYKCHRQIYRILMSANYDAYSEPLIGSALLEIFEGDLKRRLERAACTFCSAQATNIELLNKLTRRDTKAGEFLAQVTSQRMVGRLGVKDLLASCFQRLAKYPLLLENLLKATPKELPDDSEGDDAELAGGGGGPARSSFRGVTAARSRQQQQQQPSTPKLGGGRRGRHHRKHSQSIGDQPLGVQDDEGVDRDGVEHERPAADKTTGDSPRAGLDDHGDDDDDVDVDDDDDDDVDADDHDDDDVDDGGGGGGGGGSGGDEQKEEEELRLARLGAAEEQARRNSRRIMAISLAEEREFIERALQQSRQILVRVNDSIKVAIARNRLKEIWKRTDKYPDVPLSSIDISKQQVVHEGLLTLRLSKRSFDVYVLLLNDYIIILTREGQDKYRLKFFTPEGKSAPFQSSAAAAAASSSSSSSLGAVGNILGGSGGSGPLGVGANNFTTPNTLIGPHQTVYSPIFVIDEHLTTRDAATDENGFYLLCKRKDDSRIYEFASRSPAERLKWRDKIQTAIERQMNRKNRRPSCASTITKSSSEISANELASAAAAAAATGTRRGTEAGLNDEKSTLATTDNFIQSKGQQNEQRQDDTSAKSRTTSESRPSTLTSEPTKIVGTISYVIDDGIVLPSKMESSRVFVDQAIQVNILDGSTVRGQIVANQTTN